MMIIDRWFLKFKDDELESQYRQDNLAADKTVSIWLQTLFAVTIVAFIGADRNFVETGKLLNLLTLGRIVFGALTVAMIYYFKTYPIMPHSRDWIYSALLVYTVVFVIFVNATRPADYLTFLSLDAIGILIIYLIAPVGAVTAIVLALGWSAVDLWAVYFVKTTVTSADQFLINALFLVTNIVGYSSLRQRHIAQRRRFADEQKIQTLTGLLPICSNCKKIKDSNGTWENIEHYITMHSSAEFTHGYCPVCADIYFPPSTLEGS